jgi:thiol:disulfide interchange protein DsbD
MKTKIYSKGFSFIFLSFSFVFLSLTLPKNLLSASKIHAHPDWISERKVVKAGEEFYLGIHFKIDPKWHIYWRNGGEVGLPISFKKFESKGLEFIEKEWATPRFHKDETGLVSYIYKQEALLRIRVRVLPGLTSGQKVHLNTAISWLECKDSCIPGETQIEIILPVKNELKNISERTNFNHLLIFKSFQKMIPEKYQGKATIGPFKILDQGWDRIIQKNKKQEAYFSITMLIPKIKSESIWQGCRILPFEKKAGKLFSQKFLQSKKEWEFENGQIQSLGEKPEGKIVKFSIKVLIPRKYENLPWAEIICPELDGIAIDLPIPLKKFAIIQPVTKDEALYALADQKKNDSSIKSPGEKNSSLIFIILAAFLGGLILNIMPCVLPIISIKIFSLIKQSGEEKGKILRLGLFFSLGIIFSFMALALMVVIIKSFGLAIGWGFQFQSPIFLVFLSIILLVFGLSFFDVYTFNAPNISTTKMHTAKNAYLGSFMQGILATILATPCSAPFLGTAMGFAFAHNFVIIFLMFLVAGSGMAFPYLLLAFYPSGLKYLPRPGKWMEKFKELMGFFLMATLIWLIWILTKMVSADAIVILLVLLLLIAMALWFGGSFAPLGTPRKKFYRIWSLTLLFIALSSWYLVPIIIQSRDKGSAVNVTHTGSIAWNPFTESNLQEARASGRITFLKFTADWCLTCKVNEKTVLSAKSVQELFQRKKVIAISADWTKGDKNITRLLATFGRSGVPFYVIYPPGEKSKPIPLSELITPGMIQSVIEKY